MSDKCCCCGFHIPSLVKKYLMAVTGLVLVLFLLVHVVGNLQMFQDPSHINTYAHLLHSLPPVCLWGFRAFILLCFVVHFGIAIKLKIENLNARGPEGYLTKSTRYAAWSARMMVISGIIVLLFVFGHIIHFTILKEAGADCLAQFKDAATITAFGDHGLFGYLGTHGPAEGGAITYKVFDVYGMVYAGFSCPWIAGAYVIAMLALLSHLSHGAHSMFQSIGWRNETLRPILRGVAVVYAVVVCGGLLAVPAAIQLDQHVDTGLFPTVHKTACCACDATPENNVPATEPEVIVTIQQ
ncbi:MAG: succinate dehydrogenase cytochrome b subunit [Opitutales bacterium]|nr:succinate dehydrogenase cytochrome b subunit [Opitutales bacterium]